MSQGGLATKHAPSFVLIQAHFGLGALGLCAFAAALVAFAPGLEGHHFQSLMLGLVHLCVLGWLMPIALGAMHQLVPVVFEVPVRSERLAWGALGLYAMGTAGLVGHLWRLATGCTLVLSAGALLLSLVLYTGNLLLTLRSKRRKLSLTGFYVLCALGWLLVAAGLGFALALNLHAPFLPVSHLQLLRSHAHVAALGFFGLLIMGVAFRLMEMFLLAHGASERAGWVALAALDAGLLLLLLHDAFAASAVLLTLSLALLAAGIVSFLVQVRRIWVRRMKRLPDAAWRLTLASFTYLAGALVLGLVLWATPLPPEVGQRLVLAYGLLALPGFVGSVVVGQLYKILPFLVWLHRFSPLVGLKRVPSAAQLLPEGPKRAQEWLMHGGLLALALGIVLLSSPLRTLGAVAFAASAALGTRNLWVLARSKP